MLDCDEAELAAMEAAYLALEHEKLLCAANNHQNKFYDGEGPLKCICGIEDK